MQGSNPGLLQWLEDSLLGEENRFFCYQDLKALLTYRGKLNAPSVLWPIFCQSLALTLLLED